MAQNSPSYHHQWQQDLLLWGKNLKDFFLSNYYVFAEDKLGGWQQILHLDVAIRKESSANNKVKDCFNHSEKGIILCKRFLQDNLDLFIRLIYQVIALIHSKYLLSKSVAGYAFYFIASNFTSIWLFWITEQQPLCGDRSSTTNDKC